MEAGKSLLWPTMLFWLTIASGQVAEEPPPVITTENFQFPTFETTEKPAEAPNDNGMAIGDIPEQLEHQKTFPEQLEHPQTFPEQFKSDPPSVVEGKEEEAFAVEEQPVVVTFPENHKNFTPSQYLGDQDFPPYYNHLNSYQQQYKNYYEQKQIYNRKPIKFEENSLKNFYLPTAPNSHDLGEEKKKEDFRVNRNPFPYAFENERGQEQTQWYKTPGHAVVQEQPSNEHVFRGHHESISPYYVYPHSYPQKVKFYEGELLHYGDDHQYHQHHHLKKDEKGNPWKKVFHVLSALVPLGLLLATLTPNVIAINSTATTKTIRQRSEDSPPLRFKEEDVLMLMRKYGVDSLTEMQCEDRVICELAREGGKITAGPIEKGFWFLANQTPRDVAEKAGMNELFKAIKTGTCEVYKCHSKNKTGSKGSFGKKLIRKHKIPE